MTITNQNEKDYSNDKLIKKKFLTKISNTYVSNFSSKLKITSLKIYKNYLKSKKYKETPTKYLLC